MTALGILSQELANGRYVSTAGESCCRKDLAKFAATFCKQCHATNSLLATVRDRTLDDRRYVQFRNAENWSEHARLPSSVMRNG
jgi:hypothetical protein